MGLAGSSVLPNSTAVSRKAVSGSAAESCDASNAVSSVAGGSVPPNSSSHNPVPLLSGWNHDVSNMELFGQQGLRDVSVKLWQSQHAHDNNTNTN